MSSKSKMGDVPPDVIAEIIADLAERGVISFNGHSEDGGKSNGSGNGREPTEALIEAYKGWMPRERYLALHPIVKGGHYHAKAVLNSLAVNGGGRSIKGVKGVRGALIKNGLEMVREVKRDGTVISRFYGQRMTVDGQPDMRAPIFAQAGGRIRVDEVNKTVTLDMPEGFEFPEESVEAIGELMSS